MYVHPHPVAARPPSPQGEGKKLILWLIPTAHAVGLILSALRAWGNTTSQEANCRDPSPASRDRNDWWGPRMTGPGPSMTAGVSRASRNSVTRHQWKLMVLNISELADFSGTEGGATRAEVSNGTLVGGRQA